MIRIELEYAYWKSVLASRKIPPVSITPYVPQQRQAPARVLSVNSAWKGIESILPELIERFDIGTKSCLEFGVEFGYSTAALSSFLILSSVSTRFTVTGTQETPGTFITRRRADWPTSTTFNWYEVTIGIGSSTTPINTTSSTSISSTPLPIHTPVAYGAQTIPSAPSFTTQRVSRRSSRPSARSLAPLARSSTTSRNVLALAFLFEIPHILIECVDVL